MSDRDVVLVLLLIAVIVFAAAVIRARLRQFAGEVYVVAAPVAEGARPEEFFLNLHGLLRPPLLRLFTGQPWVLLELVGTAGHVFVQVWVPQREKPFIESLLRSVYPGMTLVPAPDPNAAARKTALASGRLARNQDLPIRRSFDGVPLSSLLWTLARVPADSTLLVQLLVRPKAGGWQRAAERRAQELRDRRGVEKSLFRPIRALGPTRNDLERAPGRSRRRHRVLVSIARFAPAPRRQAASKLVSSSVRWPPVFGVSQPRIAWPFARSSCSAAGSAAPSSAETSPSFVASS